MLLVEPEVIEDTAFVEDEYDELLRQLPIGVSQIDHDSRLCSGLCRH